MPRWITKNVALGDGAHELALTIINDGAGYQQRKTVGELMLDPIEPRLMARHAARDWLNIAIEGAREYERQFGSPGASCFTATDILGAAIELADYYENHARESATAYIDDIKRDNIVPAGSIVLGRDGTKIKNG